MTNNDTPAAGLCETRNCPVCGWMHYNGDPDCRPSQPVGENYLTKPCIELCSREALDKFLEAYWPSLLDNEHDLVTERRAGMELRTRTAHLEARVAELEGALKHVVNLYETESWPIENDLDIDKLRAALKVSP